MSAFLPALGQNVLRLDADRLRDVFSDVEDGETACVILLQSDEVRRIILPDPTRPAGADSPGSSRPLSSRAPARSTRSSRPSRSLAQCCLRPLSLRR